MFVKSVSVSVIALTSILKNAILFLSFDILFGGGLSMADNSLNGEKIYIYIWDFNSQENKGSHAALGFAGETIDFSPDGFSSKNDNRMHGCRVYELDPKKIGADPDKLLKAIKKRKRQISGNDYNYFSENCADQVCSVLREAGARDLPDKSGVHTAMPTTGGSIADAVEKEVDVPIVGWLAGRAASGIASAGVWLTGQDTVEEYCQDKGKLVETRLPAIQFNSIKSDYRRYMKILQNPEAYRKEMREECAEELSGSGASANSMVSDLYEKYKNTLSGEQKTMFEQAYATFATFVDGKVSKEEEMKIKAEYASKIALSYLSQEEIKKRLHNLYMQCGSDELLRYELDKIGMESVPLVAAEFKAEKAEYERKAKKFIRRLSGRGEMLDSRPRNDRGLPPDMRGNSGDLGRA